MNAITISMIEQIEVYCLLTTYCLAFPQTTYEPLISYCLTLTNFAQSYNTLLPPEILVKLLRRENLDLTLVCDQKSTIPHSPQRPIVRQIQPEGELG
jgi:hypothetical protein